MSTTINIIIASITTMLAKKGAEIVDSALHQFTVFSGLATLKHHINHYLL